MANEAIYKDVVLKIGTKLMAGLTSFDWQTAVDMIETTNFQTAAANKTFKPGRVNRTVSIEGVHDPNYTATTMQDFWALEALVASETSSTIRIYEVQTTGGKYVEFSGYINNLSVKNQDNSTVNISGSFQISGGRTVGATT